MTDLITVEGGPERFFRVSRPTADGEVISSSLSAGPWLNGPAGRPLAGALGVLIDDVPRVLTSPPEVRPGRRQETTWPRTWAVSCTTPRAARCSS